jgi:V8-like Glu-specific endopeptidase
MANGDGDVHDRRGRNRIFAYSSVMVAVLLTVSGCPGPGGDGHGGLSPAAPADVPSGAAGTQLFPWEIAALRGASKPGVHYKELVETQCGVTDDSQDVERYNGTLGVTPSFVASHQAPVAIIRLSNGAPLCTGTLISRTLLLTAGHCFSSPPRGQTAAEFARSTTAVFNYQDDPNGTPRPPASFAITALEELAQSGADYAIVKLASSPGGSFGIAHLAHQGTALNRTAAIIGHPAGAPKRIEAGPITVLDADRIGYNDIDTLGGNSGSGILDGQTGELIGVHTNGGCTRTGGYNYGVPVTKLRDVSPRIWSLSTSRFVQQTGTALHETPSDFEFLVAGNGDLFAIKKRNTGSSSTEVHVLSAASDYRSFSLQTGTALHETGDEFEFALARNGDLFAIKKRNTGSSSTEVHVLSAASDYRSFSLQTGTALHETGGEFEFEVASNRDLFAIKKRGTGSGSTEVHVLSATSGYRAFALQTPTTLGETGDNVRFGLDAQRNVWAIKTSDTDSMSTEVHVLAADSSYRTFRTQVGTVLHETPKGFSFAVGSDNRLFAIKRVATGTGSTEVHVIQID